MRLPAAELGRDQETEVTGLVLPTPAVRNQRFSSSADFPGAYHERGGFLYPKPGFPGDYQL